jgi:two-component system cell cycle sensor histidine kinase/response regulator CckA
MTEYPQQSALDPLAVRILLIDDGGCSPGQIHQLLSDSDLGVFTLDCITNIVSAVNKFRGDAHDVCIVDTSWDVRAEYLAQLRRVGCRMPAIVITSNSGAEVVEAFRTGAADCLLRDELEPAKLEQAICRVIEETHITCNRSNNEQRYLGLIENAKDIIYTHDLSGNYRSANKAAERLTGYSQEEILNLNARQVVAPEDLELSLEMLRRKLDSQQGTSYEIEMLTKSGKRIPVEVNSHLIYNAGVPVGVQGIARDISERRSVENALRNSEERYRELFENANDIVYVHDLQGRFLSLNKTGERISGYSREEALKMNVAQMIAPEHLKDAQRKMSQQTEPNASTPYDLDIITKSGRRVSLEVNTRLIYAGGEPVALQGIARDITERKRSELERRVILEIIQSVTLTSNLDDLLRMVHAALGKILYAENCFVALYDKQTDLFSRPFFVDRYDSPTPPNKMTRGMTAYVFRKEQPFLLNKQIFDDLVDAGEVERVGRFAPSWLGVPLKTPTRTIGVLVVQHYEDGDAYTASDLEFLNSVGGQIALAIERKRAEEALKHSEEQYRDIFDNATMGIYRSSRDGQILAANKAFAELLGYSSVSELLNLNLAKDIYYQPDERDKLIVERMTTGAAQGLEVLWKKKDGAPIWVQLNAIAVMEDGEPVLFDGFIHEITQRKQAESALRESEDRYQRLVELSPDGIIVHTDGVISFVNSSTARMVGAPSAESFLGRSIFEFIDESQREMFQDRVQRLQLGESQPAVEVRGKRWNGSDIECEVMSVPFTTAERPAVQVVIRDITQRKQSEAALVEANQRALADYERLVERIATLGQSLGNARELTSILRAVRDFTTASVPCDGMLISLYDADAKLRRGVYCWVDDHEIESDQMSFPVGNGMNGRAIKTGSIVVENDYQEYLKSTSPIVIGDCSENIPKSALTAPMVIMGRTVGCIEIQSYDLDAYTREHLTAMAMAANLAANAVENVALMEREQEQAEQLRQSQKMEAVGQLAGGVAHDFNNLLTAISGYSDLGLRKVPEGNPLRRNLEEIKKASTRATSLTRQLLAFSRKQMLQAKVIDMNAIVSDMDRMLRRLIGEDIDLVTALEPSTCQVKADPGQIEQVILNLAVNARDAMPRGGKLTIETSHIYLDEAYSRGHVAVKSGYYVMLGVSDTGAGMDQETQKRVFEPFFTTKEVGKGTGLGLSTVYGIVKQSGGNIWVYSEPGHGSTFKIYLPSVNELTETEIKPNNTETLRGEETILLVEDEEMVRNLSREILEMNGYRVITANNGAEALRICASFKDEVQLMITDVVMPQMSGRELSERILEKRPDLLVLYMSGYTDDAIVRHGVLDDGMPFLQKPFTPDALARKVKELIEQSVTVKK